MWRLISVIVVNRVVLVLLLGVARRGDLHCFRKEWNEFVLRHTVFRTCVRRYLDLIETILIIDGTQRTYIRLFWHKIMRRGWELSLVLLWWSLIGDTWLGSVGVRWGKLPRSNYLLHRYVHRLIRCPFPCPTTGTCVKSWASIGLFVSSLARIQRRVNTISLCRLLRIQT